MISTLGEAALSTKQDQYTNTILGTHGQRSQSAPRIILVLQSLMVGWFWQVGRSLKALLLMLFMFWKNPKSGNLYLGFPPHDHIQLSFRMTPHLLSVGVSLVRLMGRCPHTPLPLRYSEKRPHSGTKQNLCLLKLVLYHSQSSMIRVIFLEESRMEDSYPDELSVPPSPLFFLPLPPHCHPHGRTSPTAHSTSPLQQNWGAASWLLEEQIPPSLHPHQSISTSPVPRPG